MKRLALCAALAVALPAVTLPAAAQAPIPGDAARRLAFHPERVEVQVFSVPGLTEREVEILKSLAGQQLYYAALAVSTGDGIATEATALVANFHSPADARRAALAQCEANRKSDTACAVVVETRPRRWEERAMTFSAGASAALAGDYRRTRGAKAFAVSAETGRFGIGTGADAAAAAVAACGADDCRVVVAD